MKEKTLIFITLLALFVSCKGGGAGDSVNKSVSESVTPHTDQESGSTHLDQWFYLGFEIPDDKLIVIRTKVTSDNYIIVEQHSLNKNNLYMSVYQRTKSKLSPLGNKWQTNDVVRTCGQLSQGAVAIEASSERLSLEDDEGVKLTFRAESGFYRSLFEQIVVEQMDSECALTTEETTPSEDFEELVPPPFAYAQYKLPEWSSNDLAHFRAPTSSVQCQSGARLAPVTFNIRTTGTGNTLVSSSSTAGPHTSSPVGRFYIGISAFNDMIFVQKVSDAGYYNVTLSFCPQAAGSIPFVSDERVLSSLTLPNGITLNDTEQANREDGYIYRSVTSAQSTQVKTGSIEVMVNGEKKTAPEASVVSTFYAPRFN